jgi:hypothetical protein
MLLEQFDRIPDITDAHDLLAWNEWGIARMAIVIDPSALVTIVFDEPCFSTSLCVHNVF